jgi:hypothetical protein
MSHTPSPATTPEKSQMSGLFSFFLSLNLQVPMNK